MVEDWRERRRRGREHRLCPALGADFRFESNPCPNIVAYRDENGAFDSRKKLLKVPRLGEKTFEQAAGFLRINGGKEPLDASAVHPEAYPASPKCWRNKALPPPNSSAIASA